MNQLQSFTRFTSVVLLVACFAFVAACGSTASSESSKSTSSTAGTAMFDGTSLAGWNRLGDANWRVADGAIVADQGVGFLVSAQSYGDFRLVAEFWADADVNSGIFIRAADANMITPANSYEVNIYDKRTDPSYGTGAIVDVAKVSPMPKAVGRWNTFEITAQGARLRVVMNGVETVNVENSKLARGPIALQYAKGASPMAGLVKFRKLVVTPLAATK
jgi:hypothetical protein